MQNRWEKGYCTEIEGITQIEILSDGTRLLSISSFRSALVDIYLVSLSISYPYSHSWNLVGYNRERGMD